MPGKGWGLQNRRRGAYAKFYPYKMGVRKNCYYAEGRGTNRFEVVSTQDT